MASGPGGPDALRLEEVDRPEPAPGELSIEVEAAGVNFADLHQVEDTYLTPTAFPMVPGSEVVGRDQDGRRVLALVDGGGYAEYATASPQLAWEVPDAISDGAALSALIQGATAWHLLRTCGSLQPGETVVVHAAGGGVGTLAVQLARQWGAGNVIAAASTAAKRELALELGANEAIDSTAPQLEEAIREANGGRPVDLVLEMTGGPSFDQSLRALAPFGRLVTYGQAGRVEATPVAPWKLVRSSRAVIGFWLAHCIRRPGMLGEAVEGVLAEIEAERLRPIVGASFALAEAAAAHRALGSRQSQGKLILVP